MQCFPDASRKSGQGFPISCLPRAPTHRIRLQGPACRRTEHLSQIPTRHVGLALPQLLKMLLPPWANVVNEKPPLPVLRLSEILALDLDCCTTQS